jgi:hypothetical protein
MVLLETSAGLGPWSSGGAATVRSIDLDDTPLVGEDRPFGRVHRMERIRFASVPNSAMAAILDGSVREISHTISADSLAAAATIAGGDVLGNDW